MKKKAILVHLNGLASVTPLVGGYLKAFALAEPELARDWEIELYNETARVPASEVLHHLATSAPDLVAFSVYTWNVRLVQRLVGALPAVLAPSARILVGGVEVMHCGERFLDPRREDVALCNGEGERTFRDLLLELGEERPDLERVRGLSFRREGALVTTPENERIRDLSEIPSPWLTGAIEARHLAGMVLFETNRGCPYKCEFCYWGGAIGQKITRLPLERIKDELSLIVRHRPRMLALCDANFGQLAHDVEVAEHLARLKREHGFPSRLGYNSAKNRVDRVETIARIFAEARLQSSHTISLQTTTPRALELAKRENIRTEAYLELQRTLNRARLPSFIEMIWPMPGETPDSFREGIDGLCRMGAQSFFVHPLLWLNNVGYEQRAEELGVHVLDSEDPKGDPPIVIRTREVGYHEYRAGLEFTNALLFLYSLRGLFTTMHVLDRMGTPYRAVLDAFCDWMRGRDGDPVAELWEEGRVRFLEMAHTIWPGRVAHTLLHAQRQAYDARLADFVTAHLDAWTAGAPPGAARRVRAALDYDLLTRPFLYLNAEQTPGVELAVLEVRARRRMTWSVRSPYDFPRLVRAVATGEPLPEEAWLAGSFDLEIDHRTRQTLPPSGWGPEEFHWNGSMASREIGQYEPRVQESPPADEARRAASG